LPLIRHEFIIIVLLHATAYCLSSVTSSFLSSVHPFGIFPTANLTNAYGDHDADWNAAKKKYHTMYVFECDSDSLVSLNPRNAQ